MTMTTTADMMLTSGNDTINIVHHSMPMAFTGAHNTPLYSMDWTPTTHSAYAATCLFLIALAVISRLLQAYRSLLEQRWRERASQHRRYVLVAEESERREKQLRTGAGSSSDEEEAALGGSGESGRVVRAPRGFGSKPWRFSTDLPRALVYVVQAGVGYLLMLAVMTLNVGYFLSVLGGLFLGELTVGRYIHSEDDHH